MRSLAIIVVLLSAGCGEQSPTPAASTAPAPMVKGRDTVPHAVANTPLSETTVGGVVLAPKTLVNGRLALLVPREFSMMDEAMLRLKYPSEKRPSHVFTDASGAINIAVNHTSDRMPQSEIVAFHKHMDRLFHNLYPSATWFKSDVVDVNGREWLTIDLRTPAVDTQVRNIMFGTSLDGRLLLVSFNVTKELEDQWLEPAEVIVHSLQLSD